jgi:hypothetical protein
MANTKAVHAQRLGKEQNSSRTGMTTLLKVCDAIQIIVFGTALLRMGLLWSADNYLSNLVCSAHRALTGHEGESAVMWFGIIMQLLKLCGVFHNFVHRSTIAAQRSSHLSTTF